MTLLQEITQKQQTAAHPSNSVWVSASAGSGKTKVLTDRVLNLLLSNTAPEKLLCLTFTKAAAAEMANRITSTLKSWAIAPDEELITQLKKLKGFTPTAEIMRTARALFVKVLETPGGLKIMTIHSFCQSVLKRFPIEAEISPQFEVIDEVTSHALMQQAITETFLNTQFKDDTALLSDYLYDKAIKNIFDMILQNQSLLEERLGIHLDLKNIKNNLKQYFNIAKYHSKKDIINEHFSLDNFNELKNKYLTQKETIKSTQKENPEAYLIWETVNRLKAFDLVEVTVSLTHLIWHILQRYQSLKKEESFMDYADLISTTKKLLKKSGMSEWVLFKLDGGIDHILIDEAQDTNPEQWEIIRLISEEFFSGLGSKTDIVRTIFAVGDKKQSIYSFQGADPNEFEKMHQFFKNKVLSSEKHFETVPLNMSFRSTKSVLNLVNFLLDNPKAKKGLLDKKEEAIHIPFRDQDAGLVEIWPIEEPEEKENISNWSFPEPQKNPSAVTRLAQKIANKIKQMIGNEILESRGTPIEAGDIMILVRRRNKIVSELVRALKEKNIPVAGVDRIVLTEHIAVQDLISVAKFALLPEDDLNLACLLKSPLIKLSEEELFELAHDRGPTSLFYQIQKAKPDIAQKLYTILNQADKMPVFEFFSYILGPMGGRKDFSTRLGAEVNEALDEFLSLTLNFEQTQIPSLQNFLKWINNRKVEIKRDLDQSGINAVRIMTIHASKGLQGNIVFLPDTRVVPKTKETFLWNENNMPVWVAGSALKIPQTDKLYEKLDDLQAEEYNRLLYVALTRAKDRLYICGWDNKKTKKETVTANWYDLILSSLPTEIKPDADKIIRITNQQLKRIDITPIKTNTPQTITLPNFIFSSPVKEGPLSKPLMPSKSDEEYVETHSVLGADRSYAMRRGTFIHQLLQYLPDIKEDKRRMVANRLKPDDIEIPENLFTLFEKEEFKHLFSKTSQAEVPIVGVLNNQVISGQIDRVAITDDYVFLVDFKSGKYVPSSEQEVPLSYQKQMQIYKNLLKKIFPDKMIRTFLLWTENLTLMELFKDEN